MIYTVGFIIWSRSDAIQLSAVFVQYYHSRHPLVRSTCFCFMVRIELCTTNSTTTLDFGTSACPGINRIRWYNLFGKGSFNFILTDNCRSPIRSHWQSSASAVTIHDHLSAAWQQVDNPVASYHSHD
jgi:hypothetical protein